jgi:hypothetical protein
MATVVVAAGILLGTSGCNLYAPQATTNSYDASDGVSGDVGDLALRNAILFTDDGESANLLVHVVNSSADDVDLVVQYEGADDRVTTEVTVAGNSTTEFGVEGGETVLVDSPDAAAGSLFPVFFQYGDLTGTELLVPVLDGSMEAYSTLVPTPAPIPARTSDPVETPEATTEPDNTSTP